MTVPGFLSRLQAAIGVGFLLTFVGFSLWAGFDAPYRDDWDWLWFTLADQSGPAGLLQPHNEHVVPIARLLLTAQVRLSGLGGHLIQYVSLGCHLVIVWAFLREVQRRWPSSRAWAYGVGGAVLVCLAFTQQLQSIVFAAAGLFPLVQMWATLATVALLQATDAALTGAHRRRWLVATAGCVVMAALSTTSGLAVPWVLAGVAWLRRSPGRHIAAWVATGVAFGLTYVSWVGIGQTPAGTGSVEPWAPPGAAAMMAYGFAVFSGGLSYVQPALAVVAGAAVVGGVIVAGVVALRSRAQLSRLEVFALAQMAFGMASAIMVIPGRAQFGVTQAGQSRYATFVLCLIAALVMFAASRIARRLDSAPSRRLETLLASAAVCISLLAVIPNVYLGFLWKAKADNVALAYLTVRAGAIDTAWALTLHPQPEVVARTLQLARQSGYQVEDVRLGQPATSDVLPLCNGSGSLLRRNRDGAMWMTGQLETGSTEGFVVDAAGLIVGLTRSAPWVMEPEPSVRDVHETMWRYLTSGRSNPTTTAGFAQAGAGGPYQWISGASPAAGQCRAPLTVVPELRVSLDVAALDANGSVVAAGWAFACGEDIVRWELLINDGLVDAHVTPGLARPDVSDAFRRACGPGPDSGVHLSSASPLAPGRHVVRLRVTTASGATADSDARSLLVTGAGGGL